MSDRPQTRGSRRELVDHEPPRVELVLARRSEESVDKAGYERVLVTRLRSPWKYERDARACSRNAGAFTGANAQRQSDDGSGKRDDADERERSDEATRSACPPRRRRGRRRKRQLVLVTDDLP
jgi:hypothetical protein